MLATARGAKAVKAGLKPLLGFGPAAIDDGGGFGGNECPGAPGYAIMNICFLSKVVVRTYQKPERLKNDCKSYQTRLKLVINFSQTCEELIVNAIDNPFWLEYEQRRCRRSGSNTCDA